MAYSTHAQPLDDLLTELGMQLAGLRELSGHVARANTHVDDALAVELNAIHNGLRALVGISNELSEEIRLHADTPTETTLS